MFERIHKANEACPCFNQQLSLPPQDLLWLFNISKLQKGREEKKSMIDTFQLALVCIIFANAHMYYIVHSETTHYSGTHTCTVTT